MEQFEFSSAVRDGEVAPSSGLLELTVTLDVAGGCFRFEWRRSSTGEITARGQLKPSPALWPGFRDLDWTAEAGVGPEQDHCNQWPASIRALLQRLRKRFPIADDQVHIQILADADIGPARKGAPYRFTPFEPSEVWKWLAREIQEFARLRQAVVKLIGNRALERHGQVAARTLAHSWLGIAPADSLAGSRPEPVADALRLRVTLDFVQSAIELKWLDPSGRHVVAQGRVGCTGLDTLTWELEVAGRKESLRCSINATAIRTTLNHWLDRYPVPDQNVLGFRVQPDAGGRKSVCIPEPPFADDETPRVWLEHHIEAMGRQLSKEFALAPGPLGDLDPLLMADLERDERRFLRKEQKRAQEEQRRQETMARLAEERRRKQRMIEEHKAAATRKAAEAGKLQGQIQGRLQSAAAQGLAGEPMPLPAVPVRLELPSLEFQETSFPLGNLRSYALRERAALWWVSNQSDDLLCLPYCRIERLEYQLRTALRALGPLRGRALLSDEVGLGKTIEAGLVLKELLTRGMVKRFLVLTVPSLVDQWEEELSDKFGLTTATTNQAGARSDPEKFWRENTGLVASLHTLKQPAQLAVARQVHWDMLIVDEAHYLRNRDSQAWQAVSALSRHFLLLLTATPVQNSLEELYNLVTLLQPGQLPTPKEFRARFIDPKRPRQPREQEELRRLLGQVMIRNTRANAGVDLPPRRAETVLFEPTEAERGFWTQWEAEFRTRLAGLSPSQSSLWGRLLLQAAGSSPAAWRDALEKFPDRAAAQAWREQAPLEASWQRKCELLLPLTRGEGGAVMFTQFLQTQAAAADYLRRAGVETFVINGATPAAERQPITEEFHRRGGALLLTHSGTEGRNLQFSHRLANFDLPWNPMEIEQRIGRLHRLGQRHPVRIYNFVQAGTLQESLLQILQEKLNLFELVVGETGLILGEKFSSDEFAEEVLRRWREGEGRVAEALAGLGEELAAARDAYGEVKKLDETLFSKDYESL